MEILRAFVSLSTIILIYLILDRKKSEINQKLSDAVNNNGFHANDNFSTVTARKKRSSSISIKRQSQQASVPTRRKSSATSTGNEVKDGSDANSGPMVTIASNRSSEMKEPLLPPGSVAVGYGGVSNKGDEDSSSVPLERQDRKTSNTGNTTKDDRDHSGGGDHDLEDVAPARGKRHHRVAMKNVAFDGNNEEDRDLSIGICGVLNLNPKRRIYWKVWLQVS
jgi:hypothetical protein